MLAITPTGIQERVHQGDAANLCAILLLMIEAQHPLLLLSGTPGCQSACHNPVDYLTQLGCTARERGHGIASRAMDCNRLRSNSGESWLEASVLLWQLAIASCRSPRMHSCSSHAQASSLTGIAPPTRSRVSRSQAAAAQALPCARSHGRGGPSTWVTQRPPERRVAAHARSHRHGGCWRHPQLQPTKGGVASNRGARPGC